MISHLMKSILAGATLATVALPGLAMAGTTCVYVIGKVAGQSVTTPAVPIVIPASQALTEPVRVHVDDAAQNIIGYSLNVPGADLGTEGTPLFSIPAINEQIPSFTVNLPDLNYAPYRCVDVSGATVPAIPYNIPASALLLPGGVVDVGSVFFNITGHELAVPGKVLSFDGRQILIPQQTGSTPAVPVGTPDLSVTFTLNGAVTALHYLLPH